MACTKAPRAPAFVIVQPDWAGVMPLGPVSWYGVARPCALSGLAWTMMLQFTFAAAAVAVAVGVAVAVVVGQIVGVADAVAVAAVVAAVVAVAVGAAVAVVVGAAVAAAVAAVVAAAVPSGVGAAVPDGVGATVAAAAAVVAVNAGVAQPATFAASLAPNTLRKPGATSSAKPSPATTATTPPIAISRVRDRGSRS